MREDAFRRKVVRHAQNQGWRVAFWHRLPTRDTQWRTPVGGDAKGFPDLTLVRDRRLLFVELKGDSGRLAPDQREWLDRLSKCPVETYVWKPRMWDEIEAILAPNERQLRIQDACGGDRDQVEGVMRMLK